MSDSRFDDPTRQQFVQTGDLSWYIHWPYWENADLVIRDVTLYVYKTKPGADAPMYMNVQCALWSPKDVLTSDDQDQRPKLFIRYKSSASPDGALALAIAYPYDKVNVTNQQRNGLELTDGFPEWGELAIRERRT